MTNDPWEHPQHIVNPDGSMREPTKEEKESGEIELVDFPAESGLSDEFKYRDLL